jgi:Tol biopolymer transport system component
MAQAFDPAKRQLSGQAFPIAEDVGFNSAWTVGSFSASANGILAMGTAGGATGNRQFVWYDRSGKRIEKVGTPGTLFDFALSPDEKRVVFRRVDPQTRNNDLWLLDLIRQTESRFTFNQTVDDDPVWSPDGNKILFDSNPDGQANLHQKIATGAGSEELLLKSPQPNWPLDWSSDGRYILYEVENTKTKGDLWIFPIGGDKKPFPFVQTNALEYTGKFSPDGHWIAYSSDESEKMEVYVQAFPLTQGKWQVSVGGGGGPQWSKDGKQIYYVAPDKNLMEVDVKGMGASFEQGIPKPLFNVDIDSYQAPNRYAVSKDGKRFLVNTSIEGTSIKPIMVVMNWTADIKTK